MGSKLHRSLASAQVVNTLVSELYTTPNVKLLNGKWTAFVDHFSTPVIIQCALQHKSASHTGGRGCHTKWYH